MGWTEHEICVRSATEIDSASYVYLGGGLPRNVCDFVPAFKPVMFHFGEGVFALNPKANCENLPQEEISKSPRATTVISQKSTLKIRENRNFPEKIGVAFLEAAFIPTLGFSGPVDTFSKVNNPGNHRSEYRLDAGRLVILISDSAKARNEGIFQRLTDTISEGLFATQSVRIISDVGVIDVSQTGSSVVELAPGIRIDDIEQVIGTRPGYTVHRSTENLPVFRQIE